MKILNSIVLILLIIGGINWGLIGLFEFDLVAYLFGTLSLISKIVYTIVGACAIYSLMFLAKIAED